MNKTALRKGFTLLELLMVVIIIAILAAIALPQYIKVSERARAAEALQVVGSIRSSEMRYRSQNPAGNYTDVPTELDIDMPLDGTGKSQSLNWDFAATAIVETDGDNTVNPPVAPKGFATAPRSGGQYNGNTVGLTFGTGTQCGDFPPLVGTTAVDCAAIQD